MILGERPIITYSVFFIIALVFASLINFLLLKSLKKLGVNQVKRQNNKAMVRWASQSKPSIGGFSFFLLFLLSFVSHSFLPFAVPSLPVKEMFALVASVALGFTVGLVDDSYTTPPAFKFVGQLLCAFTIISLGVFIPISSSYWFNVAFTTFWVVGIMNSINMLDNMDGITTSVACFIVLSCLLILYFHHPFQSVYVIVLVGVLAALIGFLIFNWYPSKIYMGDSGSQFLGVFLAFVSIKLMWTQRSGDTSLELAQFAIPALAFLLPIIDTTTVFIRRIKRGQSPFVGGRDHTTHHIAYCGLSDSQVALVFVALSTISFCINYYLIVKIPNWTSIDVLCSLLYCLFIFLVIQVIYEIGKKKAKQNDN